MDVGTDASTIPIFVLIRLLLMILVNWPMILVAVEMTMTGAVIFVAYVMALAWHMLFFVT